MVDDGSGGCHDVDNHTAFSQMGLGRIVDGGEGCHDVDKRTERLSFRRDLAQ